MDDLDTFPHVGAQPGRIARDDADGLAAASTVSTTWCPMFPVGAVMTIMASLQ
ncbi:hypothetical protein ACFQY7_21020 [Actinomadura luteofluorescens]|uniref:hypothetical protein n=1 Tax=Actinomadura luteofluorescens TaxID=46163 RepID=UPI003645AECB